MEAKKSILICPLDWGLGHATRCVPVIRELLRLNFNVIIGADKKPLAFLKQEFPELSTIIIPGYEITYGEKGSSFKLFCESVRFYNFIKKEHQILKKVLEENNIDVIISDNRYGLWNKKVKSIIITHQLYVKTPFGGYLAHKKIHGLLAKFDDCWIPDIQNQPHLSGDLAHLKPIKFAHRFIGPLSRFSEKELGYNKIDSSLGDENGCKEEYDILAIFSGPEPQRTIFEQIILKQLEASDLKAVVVRGLPNADTKIVSSNSNISIFNHLNTSAFFEYFQKSKAVICRAGYSSIMDLVVLKKRAILVPTPGQTEQEYLAKYHFKKGNFYMQNQRDINLQKMVFQVQKYSPKYNPKLTLNINFIG